MHSAQLHVMLVLELAQAQLLEEVLLQVEATAKPGKIQLAMMLTVLNGQVKADVKNILII
jgi:hypothetical protein